MLASVQQVARPWCGRRHGRAAQAVSRRRSHCSSAAAVRPPRWVRQAAAQRGTGQDELEKQVMESAGVLDEMVDEIMRELLLSSSVSYVTGEPEEATAAAAVKAAVSSRIESLNNTFIPVVASYAQGASEQGNEDIAALLVAIHDEVLAGIEQRLPPEMRVLNAALLETNGTARVELIKRQTGRAADAADAAAGAGSAQLPACELADLERAVSQLLDDMECMPEIPDRQLLARMCVLREEVHDLMREQALLGSSSSSRQAGEPAAAPEPPKPQPPRLHPKYKDPTFQAAEVSEPGSGTGQAGAAPAAGTGFGRPRPAQRGKRRGAAEQLPAQEVEVEVVGAGLQGSSDEEEEEEMLVQPQPAGPEPSPAAAAAEEERAGQREPGFVAPYAAMGAVPRSAVAFLKEVLAVQSSEKRRALLEKAFRTDWWGAAPSSGGPVGGAASGEDAEYYEKQRQLLERLAGKHTDADVLPPSGTEDLVRPGRFMQCLNVVQAELVQQAEADVEAAAAAEAAGAPEPLPEVGEALLQRLEDVRREALVVLMDLAGEEGTEYRP